MTASKWATFPCLAFDTETTGTNPAEDRIVTAALVWVDPNKGHPVVRRYITDPGIDIPEAATEVHGYTRDRAIAEQTHTPEQLAFEVTMHLAKWLGTRCPIVAFNAAFDLTLLEAENHRHGVDGLVARFGHGKVSPIVDPHVLDKYADPYRKGGRTLTTVCGHYGVVHTGAHDSAGDALAAARLWPRILARHARKFPGMTMPALHQSQVGWRKAQADGLRDYFDKKGIEHDGVDPGWPFYLTAQRQAVAS